MELVLSPILGKRCVLVTGKGGVGRSTVAAALAIAARKRGLSVLLSEVAEDTDDYSPLARHFNRHRLPPVPEDLVSGLRGVALMPSVGQEMFLRDVLHSATVVRAALASETIRRLLAAGPSFREMGLYYQLLTYLRAPKSPDGDVDEAPLYDMVIVDMPATGHTLSLTGLPDLLLRLISRGPIAAALREGVKFLSDPKKTAAWVVTLPETLPVSECLELCEGLQKNATPIGGILVNKMPQDSFTPAEREALRPLIEGRRVFGADGFNRVDLARRSVARLQTAAPAPVGLLPEVTLPQSDLIPYLVEELEQLVVTPSGATSVARSEPSSQPMTSQQFAAAAT